MGNNDPITINHCDGNGRKWVIEKENGRNTMIVDGTHVAVTVW